MKYIIYLRVSTDQQVLSGLGLESQRQTCMKLVPSQAEILEFIDEGFSGALEMEKRPALLSALNILEKGDILLFAQRDRLGRDPIVNAMIERAVERKKARLVSASGDTRDDNDPSSILMRRMVDAFAEYERLIIGARTKAALQVKKRRNERVGYIPYGYKLCDDKIHIQICKSEQNVLSTLKNLRNDGLSFRKIAQHLNTMQIHNRKGSFWTHVSITRVMK